MKLSENLGSLLLSLWLIVTALVSLLSIHHPLLARAVPLLALAAGFLLLLGAGKLPGTWGILLLAIWLILRGAMPFLAVHIPGFSMITALLALAAGLLILFKR